MRVLGGNQRYSSKSVSPAQRILGAVAGDKKDILNYALIGPFYDLNLYCLKLYV